MNRLTDELGMMWIKAAMAYFIIRLLSRHLLGEARNNTKILSVYSQGSVGHSVCSLTKLSQKRHGVSKFHCLVTSSGSGPLLFSTSALKMKSSLEKFICDCEEIIIIGTSRHYMLLANLSRIANKNQERVPSSIKRSRKPRSNEPASIELLLPSYLQSRHAVPLK